MISLFLNEQKKKRYTDIPLRKGTLDNVFAPKNIGKLLFKAQNTEPFS